VLDLLSGRHQLRAVRKSPAVILNMGDLDAAGAKRDRLINHGRIVRGGDPSNER